MLRHRRPILVPLGLLACLVLGQAPAVAEKPMSSPAQLAASATHVVRGEVVRVFPRVRRQGSFENTQYVAEVKVADVEKGEGIPADRPLYVRYWTKYWQGPGAPPAGTTGHAPLPEEGTAVRLYLARNAYDGFGRDNEDGGLNVIGANGFEALADGDEDADDDHPRGSADR